MTRASISISPPNDKWIQGQIESEQFSSRSEVVNDLKAALTQGEKTETGTKPAMSIRVIMLESPQV